MPRQSKATYLMVGGFLGAGKTTAVAWLAQQLVEGGQRVGLITNDQSTGLVDTSILRSRGFAVEEIPGGCFCCRFSSLTEAAERLETVARPDVFLAEPVGSCTDLVATVSYPLRRLYGDRFRIAPLSVLVDPARAMRILGLGAVGRAFSDKVAYVYLKQLEEADLIVINKIDQLAAGDREELVQALGECFQRAEILCVSAQTGAGMEAWLTRILEGEAPHSATMSIDYELYAEGEARLGWLNTTSRLAASGAEAVDANRLLVDLAEGIRSRLADQRVEIAHLKLTLEAGSGSGQLAALSITSGDAPADLREALVDGVHGGELVINLRAEGDPEGLNQAVREASAACVTSRPGMSLDLVHEEFFRPAAPMPTHRDEVTAAPGGS